MGIEVAAASLIVGAYSAHESHEARKEARQDMRRAAEEQKKSRAEQKAIQTQQAAQERRAQVREERVRRAKILQASENSGTSGSSGEAGALSSMATQLSNNIGINVGRVAAGNRISIFEQNAADFQMNAQDALNDAQTWDSIFGISMNMFNASGGFSNFKTK